MRWPETQRHSHLWWMQQSMSMSWHPCHQGWGWPWLPSSLSSSFLFSYFSCYILYNQSPTPSISFSSHSFLMQSSHHILGLPGLMFPSTFWASHLFAILSTLLVHVKLFLTNFFLKLSFIPTSTLSSSILLLSALFTPIILLIQLFLANLHLLLLFLC